MFRLYRIRGNYWSCSKFASWVRKTFTTIPKPAAATAEGWKQWKETSVQESKFIHWFTEEFLNKAQDFVLFPYDVWDAIRVYFRNRWITKTHAVITPLSRGKWHENDEVLLFANFQILVDFVEIEKASMSLWNEERRKRFKQQLPWYHRLPRFLRFGELRSRELGLEYLEWEMSLKNTEWVEKDDPEYGKPTQQALSACEQVELYLWWKDVRPNRPDPMDLSGYMNDWSFHKDTEDGKDIWDILSEPMSEQRKELLDMTHEIEEAQEQEDTEMLIRLIKIRKHLWT